MRRRTFLTGSTALGAASFLPRSRHSAEAADASVLRSVPNGDIANFNPVWGTAYSVRNAALQVWDTLYGFDENLAPRRQMIASEDVLPDGLT